MANTTPFSLSKHVLKFPDINYFSLNASHRILFYHFGNTSLLSKFLNVLSSPGFQNYGNGYAMWWRMFAFTSPRNICSSHAMGALLVAIYFFLFKSYEASLTFFMHVQGEGFGWMQKATEMPKIFLRILRVIFLCVYIYIFLK